MRRIVVLVDCFVLSLLLANCATTPSQRGIAYDIVERKSSTVIGRLTMPRPGAEPQEEAPVKLELFGRERDDEDDNLVSRRFPAYLTRDCMLLSFGSPARNSGTQVKLHRSKKSKEWSGEIVSLGFSVVTTPVKLVPHREHGRASSPVGVAAHVASHP
jgi:hypothetical protein